MLLEDYKTKKRQLERIEEVPIQETVKVPNEEKTLAVKGNGIITVAWFISEVGNIRRFTYRNKYRSLQAMNSKRTVRVSTKARTTIIKRCRRRLRRVLYQVELPMLRSATEFREVYEYYTNRVKNPLKGK